MTIEEIQNKPYGEICAALAELAPQVIEAKTRYNELATEQRLYLAARILNESGLRIGDKVRLSGAYAGRKNPIASVVEPSYTTLMFQVLRSDGKNYGEPQSEYMFNGYELLE